MSPRFRRASIRRAVISLAAVTLVAVVVGACNGITLPSGELPSLPAVSIPPLPSISIPPRPTRPPTPEPTAEPTPEPTEAPTPEPTPTPEATPAPTAAPTTTLEPAASATPVPTAAPTAAPTPTPRPTTAPTPTPAPTASPTAAPTATPEPTPEPTAEPTPSPSPTPTPTPTPSPSPAPSETPTVTPIASPPPDGGSDGGSDSSLVMLLLILVAIGLLIPAGYALWRRRQPPGSTPPPSGPVTPPEPPASSAAGSTPSARRRAGRLSRARALARPGDSRSRADILSPFRRPRAVRSAMRSLSMSIRSRLALVVAAEPARVRGSRLLGSGSSPRSATDIARVNSCAALVNFGNSLAQFQGVDIEAIGVENLAPQINNVVMSWATVKTTLTAFAAAQPEPAEAEKLATLEAAGPTSRPPGDPDRRADAGVDRRRKAAAGDVRTAYTDAFGELNCTATTPAP